MTTENKTTETCAPAATTAPAAPAPGVPTISGDYHFEHAYDAAPARVFAALTQPELFARWWGPRDHTIPTCTADVRVGGLLHYVMRSPQGEEMWCRGVYRELVAPRRLVLTDSFSNAAGEIVDHPGWSHEALISFTLTPLAGGGTQLQMRHQIDVPGEEMAKCMEHCWNESLERLAEVLA